MRGQLTDKIQELAKQYLGREISITELRLYPYIDYCIKNGGYMDRSKINRAELEILHSYDCITQLEKHSSRYVYVSKEFYDFIQQVLWESYVETKIEEREE